MPARCGPLLESAHIEALGWADACVLNNAIRALSYSA